MSETQSANAYLEGPYAPVQEEIVAKDLVASYGEIPKDLVGTFVRNGANPKMAPKGRYHWFDGDGMVHAISFEPIAKVPIPQRVPAGYHSWWVSQEDARKETVTQ